jgi:hypothetical protein
VTRAERILYHAARVREAIRQTEVRSFGDALVILDHLAYDHARDAAHAARGGR